MTPRQTPQSLPIYVQIAELLTRDIVSGRLMDGARLPPERDMATELGVSVGTLRKALRDMGEKGLIDSVQGSGNYVRAGGDTGTIYAMFRLELLEGGGLPRAHVLDVALMDKPADLPPFGTSPRASRIRRLRTLNDTIIAVEEIWLDADAGTVSEANMSDSLYATYRKTLGLWIQRAEDRVSLGAVPDWAPDAYPPRPGATAGYIERLSWADRPDTIEFSRTWFDPTRAVYVQRLK
ncbi:GntR family transcriptional regulator [uncultured Tateyamaria sp.]|uniref:GntR family transcriptional regulator n=1 Tax=uncultured Tateyamaria sp. TaxID=455651 RepID=UPI0026188F69|nr:GntR family transcriptional regulator [uncultured Tateyamaria sp.]